jgi:hypothetical protein
VHLAPAVEARLDGRTAQLSGAGGPLALTLLSGEGWEAHRGEGLGADGEAMRGWTAWRMGRFEPSTELCARLVDGQAAWALVSPGGGAGVEAVGGGAWILAAGRAKIRLRPGPDGWERAAVRVSPGG